jgi:hypothetical protein
MKFPPQKRRFAWMPVRSYMKDKGIRLNVNSERLDGAAANPDAPPLPHLSR